jgi:hypothetical protein
MDQVLHPGLPVVGDVLAEAGVWPAATHVSVEATLWGAWHGEWAIPLAELSGASSPAAALMRQLDQFCQFAQGQGAPVRRDNPDVLWRWTLEALT